MSQNPSTVPIINLINEDDDDKPQQIDPQQIDPQQNEDDDVKQKSKDDGDKQEPPTTGVVWESTEIVTLGAIEYGAIQNAKKILGWQCACDPGKSTDPVKRQNWHPFFISQCPGCSMLWPKNSEHIYVEFSSNKSAYPSTMINEYESRTYPDTINYNDELKDDEDDNDNDDNDYAKFIKVTIEPQSKRDNNNPNNNNDNNNDVGDFEIPIEEDPDNPINIGTNLLHNWGLQEYVSRLQKLGWLDYDPDAWIKLSKDYLQNNVGMTDRDADTFYRNARKWFK